MNIPLRTDPATVEREQPTADNKPFGVELMVAFLREEAWALATTAELLDRFLALRDRAGTAYAVRLLIARVRALRDVHRMLVEAIDKLDDPHGW
jgi:hypothetical protein